MAYKKENMVMTNQQGGGGREFTYWGTKTTTAKANVVTNTFVTADPDNASYPQPGDSIKFVCTDGVTEKLASAYGGTGKGFLTLL